MGGGTPLPLFFLQSNSWDKVSFQKEKEQECKKELIQEQREEGKKENLSIFRIRGEEDRFEE